MARKRRQWLDCHNCGQRVEFTIDLDLDGNHVFDCPKCGHEHCRVVRNGIITDFRWDSRNGQTYQAIYVTTASSTSTTNYAYMTWDSGTCSC